MVELLIALSSKELYALEQKPSLTSLSPGCMIGQLLIELVKMLHSWHTSPAPFFYSLAAASQVEADIVEKIYW